MAFALGTDSFPGLQPAAFWVFLALTLSHFFSVPVEAPAQKPVAHEDSVLLTQGYLYLQNQE